MKYLKLNNGLLLPQLGLGCGGIYREHDIESEDNRMLFETYIKASDTDFFLYDSEAVGFHELLLGKAIAESGRRSNMFICTKVSNKQQCAGNINAAFEQSLHKLGTDYVDMYLMHWPQTSTFIETWKQMEDIYYSGRAKTIGVCNFHPHHLEELLSHASVTPAINQFEIHPLFSQKELIKYCQSLGIVPMAYTPLGRMHDVLIRSKALIELSKKYEKTVPQIIIRWDIQQDIATIPKTTKYERVLGYLECFDFTLSDDEMAWIDEINDNVRLRYNPDKCDFAHL